MVLDAVVFGWVLCPLVAWRELWVVPVLVVVAMAISGEARESSTCEGTEKLVTYVM